MTQHTPLPWGFERNIFTPKKDDYVLRSIADGLPLAFTATGFENSKSAANAAFIVEACNSHYALKERLAEAERLIGKSRQIIERLMEADLTPKGTTLADIETADDFNQKAQAFLSKANTTTLEDVDQDNLRAMVEAGSLTYGEYVEEMERRKKGGDL